MAGYGGAGENRAVAGRWREGDIYAKWASLPEPGFHFLTRAMVNRPLVRRAGKVFTAARRFPLAAKRTIKLPARPPARAKRTAPVALRYGEVEICRPQGEQDRSLPESVRLRLIEVRETARRRKGVEPLHWRLLTTHEIADADQAWQMVGWYQARWVIEQLSRVMKSQGLQLEDSQLASAERLVKLARWPPRRRASTSSSRKSATARMAWLL